MLLEREQIRPGGFVGYAVALRMGTKSERLGGGPQRVPEEGELTMIEGGRSPHELLEPPQLLDLPIQVLVQFTDRAPDDPQLVVEEVRQIAIVGLCQEERAPILSRRVAKDARDRQVLDEPVAANAHIPREERPRG